MRTRVLRRSVRLTPRRPPPLPPPPTGRAPRCRLGRCNSSKGCRREWAMGRSSSSSQWAMAQPVSRRRWGMASSRSSRWAMAPPATNMVSRRRWAWERRGWLRARVMAWAEARRAVEARQASSGVLLQVRWVRPAEGMHHLRMAPPRSRRARDGGHRQLPAQHKACRRPTAVCRRGCSRRGCSRRGCNRRGCNRRGCSRFPRRLGRHRRSSSNRRSRSRCSRAHRVSSPQQDPREGTRRLPTRRQPPVVGHRQASRPAPAAARLLTRRPPSRPRPRPPQRRWRPRARETPCPTRYILPLASSEEVATES